MADVPHVRDLSRPSTEWRARLRRLLAFLIESQKECRERQKMVEELYK